MKLHGFMLLFQGDEWYLFFKHLFLYIFLLERGYVKHLFFKLTNRKI